jgi:hypothetical protein
VLALAPLFLGFVDSLLLLSFHSRGHYLLILSICEGRVRARVGVGIVIIVVELARWLRFPRFRHGMGLTSRYLLYVDEKELSKDWLLLLTCRYMFMFFAVGSLYIHVYLHVV